MENDLDHIRNLLGATDKEQLRYVDCFIGEDIGLFMPVGGACFYALTPGHSHPSYMFILSFNDQTSLQVNGKVITSEPGKILAMSPCIEHHELPSCAPPRYIAVFIDKMFFEEQLGKYPVNLDIVFMGESYNIDRNIFTLLKRFMIEAENRVPGREAVLLALSLEICHSIIRSIFEFSPEHDRISSRMEIDRAVEYIHANSGKKLAVDEMAGIAHMSPSNFSRVFKKEMGRPPMDYLKQVRLERAKKLLLAGDRSITEIALECGFNSPAYLSACFYRQFNMSPTGYRKGLKKGVISKKDNRISKD